MLQAAESVIGKTQAKRSALADKAYDSHSNHLYCRLHGLRDAIAERGKQESALGRRRWVIERTFGWLIKNRRLVRDFEQRIDVAETLIRIAATATMLRRIT